MITRVRSRTRSTSRLWHQVCTIQQISLWVTAKRSSPGTLVPCHSVLVTIVLSRKCALCQGPGSMKLMFCNWRNQCLSSAKVPVHERVLRSAKACLGPWILSLMWTQSVKCRLTATKHQRRGRSEWYSPCMTTSRAGPSSPRSPKFPYTETKRKGLINSTEAVRDWNTR